MSKRIIASYLSETQEELLKLLQLSVCWVSETTARRASRHWGTKLQHGWYQQEIVTTKTGRFLVSDWLEGGLPVSQNYWDEGMARLRLWEKVAPQLAQRFEEGSLGEQADMLWLLYLGEEYAKAHPEEVEGS